MIIQPVVNIAEICARKKVAHIVLSPGSRCAPLTIAFARHPQLKVKTISDERAAAFIALGMAQTTGKPTVLVCTSGTAALNYAPAVAEAFYQQVPLLILTADRPPEWIDQLDGQTIRQQQVYGQHVKKSYTFPVDFSHQDAVWYSERMVSEALNESIAFPAGPVHINIPLREPFYPTADETISFEAKVKVIEEEPNTYELSQQQKEKLQQELLQFKRILLVSGQDTYNPQLLQHIKVFAEATGSIIVGDIISNTHTLPEAIRHQDALLTCQNNEQLEALQPDLLITFGKSVISKSLKLYLRKYKLQAHWHIQPAGQVADTFQVLTKVIRCNPASFFEAMALNKSQAEGNFKESWLSLDAKAATFLEKYTSKAEYSELAVIAHVLKQLPSHSNLHLANSMAVRYANIIGLPAAKQIQVFANRGTSGIDGSTSTAVGCALSSSGINTLITGDLAFFYDRNGLWHNYLPNNLRIILLNNHAGGIFRLIDGPKQQQELEPFFETHQALNAENTAKDFKLNYISCQSLERLAEVLPVFFSPDAGASILEIFTDSKTNAASFAKYKQALLKVF